MDNTSGTRWLTGCNKQARHGMATWCLLPQTCRGLVAANKMCFLFVYIMHSSEKRDLSKKKNNPCLIMVLLAEG